VAASSSRGLDRHLIQRPPRSTRRHAPLKTWVPLAHWLERLAAKGAVVAYHDPFVPSLQLAGTSLESQELTEELLATQDCVAILTAHPSVDYPLVADVAPLVFDARGATMGIDAPNVVRL
jgi:UDP-N-acetyl-D-glucosamine dehydrogenase